MSTTNLIIKERSRNIGNLLVGRFIDHMGPSIIAPGRYLEVDQHPHIGLSTLTYLFEGEILHRDSLGSEQRITPGDVNWMTAGRGVVHTERTPPDLRDGKQYRSHGYQIWVALPKELEDMDPEFYHVPASHLPAWKNDGLNFTLIAGKAYGKESPVPVHSEMFMLKVESTRSNSLNLDNQLQGEIGFCVVDGYIEMSQSRIDKGKMLVSKANDHYQITQGENTTLLLFGGQPFEEPRYIFWNFVSSDKEKLKQASLDWQHRNFPKVDGDDTYVPLPANYSIRFK
jgi:redox-sensitive bicupin YhaK (pirin superfamily)